MPNSGLQPRADPGAQGPLAFDRQQRTPASRPKDDARLRERNSNCPPALSAAQAHIETLRRLRASPRYPGPRLGGAGVGKRPGSVGLRWEIFRGCWQSCSGSPTAAQPESMALPGSNGELKQRVSKLAAHWNHRRQLLQIPMARLYPESLKSGTLDVGPKP